MLSILVDDNDHDELGRGPLTAGSAAPGSASSGRRLRSAGLTSPERGDGSGLLPVGGEALLSSSVYVLPGDTLHRSRLVPSRHALSVNNAARAFIKDSSRIIDTKAYIDRVKQHIYLPPVVAVAKRSQTKLSASTSGSGSLGGLLRKDPEVERLMKGRKHDGELAPLFRDHLREVFKSTQLTT